MPLPVNDTVRPSVTMKCGSNSKIAKTNVCGPIFANLSWLHSTDNRFIFLHITSDPSICSFIQHIILNFEKCVAERSWNKLQLTNHGVPDEVSENLMNDIAEFFRQPLEAKKAYSRLPNSIEGYGQAFVVSDNQKLDWCDRFFLHVRPVESRERFWPTNPASFRLSSKNNPIT